MTINSTLPADNDATSFTRVPRTCKMTPVPDTPAPRIKLSKSTQVIKLLSRGRGATSNEIVEATGWQRHTVRAFLSRLRKKGTTLIRESRKSGEPAYRIAVADSAVPDASDDIVRTGEPAERGVADTAVLIEGV
jgi:hypothetical protein